MYKSQKSQPHYLQMFSNTPLNTLPNNTLPNNTLNTLPNNTLNTPLNTLPNNTLNTPLNTLPNNTLPNNTQDKKTTLLNSIQDTKIAINMAILQNKTAPDKFMFEMSHKTKEQFEKPNMKVLYFGAVYDKPFLVKKIIAGTQQILDWQDTQQFTLKSPTTISQAIEEINKLISVNVKKRKRSYSNLRILFNQGKYDLYEDEELIYDNLPTNTLVGMLMPDPIKIVEYFKTDIELCVSIINLNGKIPILHDFE